MNNYILWLDQIKKDQFNLVGGKGFNLGIMTQMNLPVPEGFAITTRAFDDFLEKTNIKDEIYKLLKELNVENTEKLLETSKRIKELIISQDIPLPIKSKITEAYRALSYSNKIMSEAALKLIAAGRSLALVAVRSSATAEDLPSVSENEFALVKIGDEIVFDRMKNIWERLDGQPLFVPSLKENKINWCKVSEVYRHKAEGNLVKILTRSGRELLITPTHSLVVLDEKEFKLKPSTIFQVNRNTRIPVVYRIPVGERDLKYLDVKKVLKDKDLTIENGRVKTNKNTSRQIGLPEKIRIDEDFAYFLGVYAAEGSVYKSCVDISCESIEIANRVRYFIQSLKLKDVATSKKNVRIFNSVLARLLRKLFGKPLDIKGKGRSARVKKVPHFIFNTNKKIIASFLRGCFDGDGYIGREISYTSVSENLIAGIATLLEFLGIKFYIYRKKRATTITILRSEAKTFLRVIGVTEKRKLRKIRKLITSYEKEEKHYDFIDNFPPSEKISGIIERTIREKYVKEKEVYVCPYCGGKMIKNGKSSSGKQRFSCKNCGKNISYPPRKKKIKQIGTRDSLGRFYKGFVPWNIGMRKPIVLGRKLLQKIADELNSDELKKIVNGDVIWDKIKKIEKVPYSGYVYDFVVPETQNFLAGAGGIITHNTASFAGQQATFLNVKGVKDLLEAVKKCWASLFEPRAIFYRAKHNIERSSISVIIQRMVNSDKSGVMFTINPTTGENNIVIEACWGLGETIVQGEVEPDRYIVSKDGKILEKHIGHKEIRRIRDFATEKTIKVPVPKELVDAQVLTEEEITTLAQYGLVLEQHYNHPQDIEFAVEQGRVYLVQTRNVTTEAKPEEAKKIAGEPILKGLGASPGIATGKVKIVHGLEDIQKVEKGDILVTTMTSPDLVPTMSRCAGIITDEGGITSHAAIVSREMEIPCIVGTEKATTTLKDGQIVTIDAYRGLVYPGEVTVKKEEKEEVTIEEARKLRTKTKIYMNLGIPEKIDEYKNLPFDGIGLMRIEFIITSQIGEHPNYLLEIGKQQKFIDKLAEGIAKVASAITPRPVIVRFSDFKTNEYHDLKGGEKYEPKENNPMLGWRGVSRYISPQFEKAFRLECKAVKKVRDELNLKNVWVMLPFVRTTWEVEKCLKIMKSEGLERSEDFKVWLMAEVPSVIFLADEFSKLCDGFSIGSNDLTQLILGVDRDSDLLANMGYFDERNSAVLRAMKTLIEHAHRNNITVSICGQSVSVYPELTEFLVRSGIDSVSVNPDAVVKARELVYEVEKKIKMESLKPLF